MSPLALSTGLVLRGGTLAGRLILLISVARHLSISDVGTLGVVAASVVTAVLLLGLDFYAFSGREIPRVGAHDQVRALVNQIVFHAVSYCVLLPAATLFLVAGVVPSNVAAWWVAIVIGEHAATELYRVLIVVEHPIAANVALFLRGAAWGIGVAALFELLPGTRTLTTVWTAWLAGAGASIALAMWTLRYLPWREAQPFAVDSAWIRRGVVVMLPLLVASLSLKWIEYSDRFFLSRIASPDAIGQFTLFSSLANSIQALVHGGVISFALPRLLRARHLEDHTTYKEERRRMLVLTVAMAVGIAASLLLSIRPLVRALEIEETTLNHLPVFVALLFANVLIVVSWVLHYDLYAKGHDRPIVAANILGAMCATTAHVVLVPRYGLSGAAVGTVLGVTAMLLVKFISVAVPGTFSQGDVASLSVVGERT